MKKEIRQEIKKELKKEVKPIIGMGKKQKIVMVLHAILFLKSKFLTQ